MLDGLVEQGLVQRVDFGDGIVRYEPCARRTTTTTTSSAATAARSSRSTTARLERAIEAVEKQSGYYVVAHDVVLRGACADCRD